MKPGLSLRVSQQLALTPQLQQAIRLLQLSTLELSAEVDRMLSENPFLELEDERAPREEFGLDAADARVSEGDRINERATLEPLADDDAPAAESGGDVAEDGWDGDGSAGLAPDDSEWGGEAPARLAGAGQDDDGADPADYVAAHETLAEYLLHQALALRLSPQDMAALRFLIESLDDDGYLHDSLAQLAATLTSDDDDLEQLEELVHRFTLALKLLQSLEPAGVGAQDLAECLTLQLKAMQADARDDAARQALDAALKICALPDALPLLAKRDARRLAKASGAGAEQVGAAMRIIARLEPKPGRRFADVARNVIVPDVIVSLAGTPHQPRLRVRLNADNVPRLRVQQAYARALRGWRGENREAVVLQLQEARWFVKSIQQRYDTVLRVARAIAERQRSFFIHGELAMRPMVQRDLAEELGMHESTISRVTTAKYMATPRGTFELKYFFGSALGTEAGGNASSTAVRALIRQLIAAEKPARPLSDQQLADTLKQQGIDCARRTVAKYREAMRIPVASLRKK